MRRFISQKNHRGPGISRIAMSLPFTVWLALLLKSVTLEFQLFKNRGLVPYFESVSLPLFGILPSG